MKYLCCENCFQTVAQFDNVTYPVSSEQFTSKFPPERQVPPPWIPGVESQYMMCPFCRKRVFNVPDPKRLSASDDYHGTNRYWVDLEVSDE